MKKKVFFGIGGVIVIIGIVLIAVFLFMSDSSAIDLTGDWKVLEHAGNVVDDEYLTFESNKVYAYKNNDSDPFIASEYKFNNTNMSLEDIGKNFTVEILSNNCLVLTESDTIRWVIIRDLKEFVAVVPELLIDKWNVSVHAGQKNVNEKMVFSNDLLSDYRDNANEPYLESSYKLNNNQLTINDISLDLTVYPVSNDVLILIEKSTGYIWEIVRDNGKNQ